MKKIFIISAALLGVILFFLIIYNFAFRKNTSQPIVQQSSGADANKTITQKNSEKITAISSQSVIGSIFDKKTETITYYSGKDGTVWLVNADGSNEKQIEKTILPGLKNVLWSSNSKVLTTFEKNGQLSFYEYDYGTRKGIALKSGLDSVVWDNLGAKIFYKYYDSATQKRSLNAANPDGSEWQKLADIAYRNISIAAVPLTSLVSFWNYPDALQETQLQTIGTAGGQAQTILKSRFGADYLWSPDGTRALVSSLSSLGGKMVSLGTVTLGGEYHDLNVPTLVSKCTWSSDGKTIYYALPGGIPDSAVMPNDYQNNKFKTEDTFWKMDMATGQKDRLIEAGSISGKYDSSDLFLSATQDALYFVNKIDGKLYRLAL
jgi:hypothetical protein